MLRSTLGFPFSILSMKNLLCASSLITTFALLSACSSNTASVIQQDPFASASSSSEAVSSAAPTPEQPAVTPPVEDPAQGRIVDMSIGDLECTPNVITVQKNSNVLMRLHDTTGTHTFISKDLGIDLTINAGETKGFNIPTENIGDFAFECGSPSAPDQVLRGHIIVQ